MLLLLSLNRRDYVDLPTTDRRQCSLLRANIPSPVACEPRSRPSGVAGVSTERSLAPVIEARDGALRAS